MATKAKINEAPSHLRPARDARTDGEYLSSSKDSDGSVGGDGGGGGGGAGPGTCAETVEASTGNDVAAGRMEDERAGGGRGKRGHFLVGGYKRPEGHLGSPRCSNSWLVRTQNSRSLHKSIMKCLGSGRKNFNFRMFW